MRPLATANDYNLVTKSAKYNGLYFYAHNIYTPRGQACPNVGLQQKMSRLWGQSAVEGWVYKAFFCRYNIHHVVYAPW